MEVRKMDLEKAFSRFKEDEIPSNWYVPAQEMYSFTAWILFHWKNGSKLRTDKVADKMLYQIWEYIEDRAVTIGKENTK